MEEWQQGYDLATLKALAAPFKECFKPYSFGAFGLPKERDVATALADNEITWTKNSSGSVEAAAIFKIVQQGSEQTDFCQRSIVIKRGDLFIKHLAGSPVGMQKIVEALLSKAERRPVWLEVHEERQEAKAVALRNGFVKAATKISASSDIKGVYLLNEDPRLRVPFPFQATDSVALKSLVKNFAAQDEISNALFELKEAHLTWEQHYSGYNKRHSWTALAIKGFDKNDPSFIIKPSEMSKGWKAENQERLRASCEFTSLAEKMPSIVKMVDKLPGRKERVRLMKIRQGDGELTRHADITDRNAGTTNGMICRLHVPLQTHPLCQFESWDLEGNHLVKHFPAGSLFYLDIRKPHAVKNNSPVERVHLVVDVISNDALRNMLNGQ